MNARILLSAIIVISMLIVSSVDAQSCSVTLSPGDDIQVAIDAASSYDVICLEPGLYVPETTIVIDKPLTLTGLDPYADVKPLIDGSGSLEIILYVDSDDVIIDGLEVAHGTGDLIFQGSSYSGTTIKNCFIHDSSGDECVQLKSCSECLIECCVAYNCAGDGINIADGSNNSIIRNNEVHHSNSPDGVIYVYYSAAMTVEGNYLHDNTASNGIKVYKMGNWGTSIVRNNLVVNNTFNGKKYSQDGNAIQLYVPFDEENVSAELFVNQNTIDYNTGNAKDTIVAGHGIYWGQKYVDGAPVNIIDNIISNNGGWGIKTELLGTVDPSGEIDHNDTWNNALGTISNAFAGMTVGPNNISDDPLYTDPGSNDYTLQAGSPCIGAGSDGQNMGVLWDELIPCGPPAQPFECYDINHLKIMIEKGTLIIRHVDVKEGAILAMLPMVDDQVLLKVEGFVFVDVPFSLFVYDSGEWIYKTPEGVSPKVDMVLNLSTCNWRAKILDIDDPGKECDLSDGISVDLYIGDRFGYFNTDDYNMKTNKIEFKRSKSERVECCIVE